MSDWKAMRTRATADRRCLSIENRLDRLTVHGDVELTKDKKGLALAKQLQAVLDATVKALEAEKALPEAVQVEKLRR